MLFDCHVHLHSEIGTSYDNLAEKMKEAGEDGAILLGDRPFTCCNPPKLMSNTERLETVMEVSVTEGAKGVKLFPFYWINPTEDDALEQVEAAAAAGVRGFKCIPTNHSPADPRAMLVWSRIAEKKLPVLFHSGILYDLTPSAKNVRPIEYEPLLFIPGFRFAMAHISWPWCDELVSILGKWTCMLKSRPDKYADFFIDTTPGTPGIYREDALRKIMTIYDFSDNIIFGSDCVATRFNPAHVNKILTMDKRALERIEEVTQEQIDSMYSGAFLRFVGER